MITRHVNDNRYHLKLKCMLLIQSIFLLTACESKTPACSSGKVIELVSASIAESLIKDGVVNYKRDDLSKLIMIDTIRTISIDEKLDSYDCNGNITIKYPTELADNIYKSYSTETGRENILQRLKIKYGEIPGYFIHGQMIAILTISSIGDIVDGMLLPNKGTEKSTSLNKALKNLLSEKIPLSYEVFPIQNAKDIDFQIKWEFDDLTDTALIELLLNISRIYELE